MNTIYRKPAKVRNWAWQPTRQRKQFIHIKPVTGGFFVNVDKFETTVRTLSFDKARQTAIGLRTRA
jgi:hypothetical protein